MGELEGWSQMVGGGRLLPNGLMPNAGPLIEGLDSERWLKAEERTAELITCILPTQPSEEHRNAVADYVQRLIMKCFPCQVFTFGSVPLKTYLPDGDIDLTAFSSNPNLKDSWASEVRDLLETEEKNENAEFHVKEVQYIQAEMKIIKCLVENIVVDISFNQLGGLCTLCFLEEVDNLINQNHLFKRSIILIKAWCYYESRILGAHRGLISTYALETLVLYIFHVFNNSFAGPLEVLYRFLEFFSNFDWDNFCVSLLGPVPISSLPDVTAEPPRKDSGELLFNKVFLDACSSVYAVFPSGQDSQGQAFLSKHFNVIDPLRVSNNLGRSVSKDNFFRIRSAFAFGAKRLARLLDCPKENLVAEVNQFFTNTWDRHGNGIRPDAPVTDSMILKSSIDSSGKKLEPENEFEEEIHSTNFRSESQPKTGVQPPNANKGQWNLKSGVNDIQRSPFARTRSSPELTDTYKYVPFQGSRNQTPNTENTPPETVSNSYYRNRRKNVEPEPLNRFENPIESNIDSNIYNNREDMHQEEQDLVNMMASSGFHGVHMPPMKLPFPISPSFVASQMVGGGGGRLLPNGLMPNAGPLIVGLDSERWLKAEERTAELITCIQPNQPSEEHRNAVVDYVQRLIMKCFPCQVFTFGSVPLKTYLPDGDIDLTAFSSNPNLKDSWASEVRDLLETEEKNENAEFHVKEVQYIQAKVKIIKCLVENIVVDISFNQLGGLCTLCFLEEVDNLINQNHLFKRSIILIKAWCYYESRILGAQHGLISTYALATLVLYIFHVFNNSFAGPLEVLYRFLEFFSNFDWDNFCVSLWGPVPISSLPDVTAEPPRKDSGELLLNKVFLDAYSSVYAVFPGVQDSQGQAFLSKHFNVIDPLRVSNNLGRSVSKVNFFRIRSAFAFGAKRLARLLDCPKENLVAEVNQFFTNTWDRHGNGIRPDAPVTDSLILKSSIDSSGKKLEPENEFEEEIHSTTFRSESQPKTGVQPPNANKGQRNLKSGHLVNDIQRSPFARTRSSPELSDTYKYVPFQGTRNKTPNTENTPPETGSNSYYRNRRKNVEPEPLNRFENPIESNIYSNIYNNREDMHQEEQDLVNMMASSGFHGVHMPPMNLPFPISPSFLASLGYTHRNLAGMFDPSFSGMQFPHGLVSPQLTHYFSGAGITLNSGEQVDPLNENLGTSEDDFWRDPEDDKLQPSSTTGMFCQPLTFYPTGPPVPFNYVPSENGSSDASTSHFGVDDSLDNGDIGQNFHSEGLNHSDDFGLRVANLGETPDEPKSDILNSDFASHWQNLQFGRFCQSPLHHGMFYQPLTFYPTGPPVIPMGPMIIGSNPRQRMVDNSGVNQPLTFYPTGPLVPFLTMLPFNYVPSENGSSDASTSHFGVDDSLDNGDIGQNFHSEGLNHSDDFGLQLK